MFLALAMLMAAAGSPEITPPAVVVQHAQGPRGAVTIRDLTTSDYPPAARNKDEQGRAVVRFLIDETGKPRDCTTTSSSGSAELDAKTCEIARRWRFKPARDAQGDPVTEYWRFAIAWRNPKAPDLLAEEPTPESSAEHSDGTMADPPLAVGTANWDAMPNFRIGKNVSVDARRLNDAVISILASRKCTFGAASVESYRIEVRYALRLSPDGKIERILVEDKGCRPLELLVASVLLQKDFVRAIEPPGGTATRWYKASVKFNHL